MLPSDIFGLAIAWITFCWFALQVSITGPRKLSTRIGCPGPRICILKRVYQTLPWDSHLRLVNCIKLDLRLQVGSKDVSCGGLRIGGVELSFILCSAPWPLGTSLAGVFKYTASPASTFLMWNPFSAWGVSCLGLEPAELEHADRGRGRRSNGHGTSNPEFCEVPPCGRW